MKFWLHPYVHDLECIIPHILGLVCSRVYTVHSGSWIRFPFPITEASERNGSSIYSGVFVFLLPFPHTELADDMSLVATAP